ncbi:MAG: pyridoxamine 5'-phosphate oxidase family protein [Defluviitaleaceae bacterium]|nr:pyridoxamine 5'-phosphate oxidase family protein [Defluviitaleaceae bacterium]
MVDYVSILAKDPAGVLATKDGEHVRTRVFQCLFTEGKKAYFCTSSEKPVYSQMNKDPYVSFCTYGKDFSPVLSISGKVAFVEDSALKVRALDENPLIKNIYGSPENPIFKIFAVDIEEVSTFSLAEGLRQYTL